jgi:hypothetical protein
MLQKYSGNRQLLLLAAGQFVAFGSHLVMHADFDDGLQKILFDQELDDALIDFLLGLGVGSLGFAEKDIV